MRCSHPMARRAFVCGWWVRAADGTFAFGGKPQGAREFVNQMFTDNCEPRKESAFIVLIFDECAPGCCLHCASAMVNSTSERLDSTASALEDIDDLNRRCDGCYIWVTSSAGESESGGGNAEND